MSSPGKSIHIQRSVRPIRLAFLVRPDDKKSLQKIFEVNTCRWGGRFNGIVPVFQRTPKWWGREPRLLPNATELAQGYLEAFEPDYVVTTHSDLTTKIRFDSERIISMNEVFQEGEDHHVLYGINISAVHKELYEKQFRFEQRHKVKAAYPIPSSKRHQNFCSAVFGAYPQTEDHSYFLKNYEEVFQPDTIRVEADNFFDLIMQTSVLPLKVGSAFIEVTKRAWSLGPTLFLLDPQKPSDLIDFWNLRALGWRVYPIPREWANALAPSCKKFVEDNHVPLRGNPNGVMHMTTVLKSRHIDESEFEEFSKQIRIAGKSALSHQSWHPRIWDAWARDKDHVERCEISHTDGEIECKVENEQIVFPSLGPNFIDHIGHSHKPRWANVVQLRDYSHKGDSAFVFPSDLQNLEKLLHTSLHRTVFPTSEGIVALIEYEKLKLYWQLPTGFAVFQAWLEEKGLKAEISPAGETTQHLVNALGGSWGVRHIADLEIIKLLDKMAHGLVEAPVDDESPKGKPVARSRMESRANWWQLLLKINENRRPVARRHLNILIDRGVLRVGLRIECSECKQANWYALGEIKEKIKCERCLRLFPFPASDPPNQAWHYRTQGAFSVENYAHGAYSAALSVRFLVNTMEANSTWTPSLNISGPDADLECDFAIWRRTSKFGTPAMVLVFGECKSFDEFKTKDVARAKQLAEKFPGSVLVFATLRTELRKDEKKRLAILANWGRKGIGGEKWRAPLIVLTAHELFSDWGPPNCWKDAGGEISKFGEAWRDFHTGLNDLADATQQLHLEMESFGAWSKKYWDKRQRSRSNAKRKNSV